MAEDKRTRREQIMAALQRKKDEDRERRDRMVAGTAAPPKPGKKKQYPRTPEGRERQMRELGRWPDGTALMQTYQGGEWLMTAIVTLPGGKKLDLHHRDRNHFPGLVAVWKLWLEWKKENLPTEKPDA